jgi:hypothetical protein
MLQKFQSRQFYRKEHHLFRAHRSGEGLGAAAVGQRAKPH